MISFGAMDLWVWMMWFACTSRVPALYYPIVTTDLGGLLKVYMYLVCIKLCIKQPYPPKAKKQVEGV